ncbi:MAG TPA: DUF72 domain-containing protein [Candidatus Thermoplasmatota archaeon]|nr:DUF72 domain-containing protein [Candidatus Thermoplasmatota archaeon]
MTRPAVRVGCTGWGYDDWRGGFYPAGCDPAEYLRRYARVFDFTEVDSTYYRLPSAEQTARWAAATPAGFLFSAKLPGAITHEARLRVGGREVDAVLDAFEPLRRAGKLGHLVAQCPPSLRRERDAEALEAFLALWPREWPLAVELRDASWWAPATYDALRRHGATLVWSDSQYGRTPPERTSDVVYVRIVGDREITRFDRIQRDRSDHLRHWLAQLEAEGHDARAWLLVVNNHLAGFAPKSAQMLARLVGAPEPDLAAAAREPGQASLGAWER